MMFLGKTAKLIRACLVGLAVAIPGLLSTQGTITKKTLLHEMCALLGLALLALIQQSV
jgi:hypothetical protein